LLGEVDNSNVKSNLLTLVGHYFESPHLKRDFAGGERKETPALFKAVKEALAAAYDLPAYRKTRFEEILVTSLGAAASDKRQNDRSLGGPDDVVVVGQARYKLRNWSPRGIL